MKDRDLEKILEIGIELTSEKNKNKLLEKMINEAVAITNCDAATLYLVNNNELVFKIMITKSQNIYKGFDDEDINLPNVEMKEENVCSFSAIHKTFINIENVYSSDKFDFSGPKKYDSLTGYHTESMLVIPMCDSKDNVIGVLQLINKIENNKIVPFSNDDGLILRSLGSMAAVAIANMLYLEEIKAQMESFVESFATAIDRRTPYNASHTRKVTEYAVLLSNKINSEYKNNNFNEYFDQERQEILKLSAGLHDIGKMIVPLSVMNKETRLSSKIEKIEDRFKYIKALYEIDYLKNNINLEEFNIKINEIDNILLDIININTLGFLNEEYREKIKYYDTLHYKNDLITIKYLEPDEVKDLSVIKGTLTNEERIIMESHVKFTKEILEQVHLTGNYKNIVKFASQHHEYLDGSGYPNKLKKEDLSLESRILTIVDIYDALTCTDRPYKKPIPVEKAFSILESMANEGKLDLELVLLFKDAVLNK